MKKTKIIATIGPACMDYEVLKAMVTAGVNVVRINLSHAKLRDMNEIVANVKKIRKELKLPLPIMIDTRGPELRVKTFKGGSAEIQKGQKFIFTTNVIEGNNLAVSINEPSIIKNIDKSHKILACDGLLTFDVLEVTDTEIITKAKNSGTISNNKSLCIPGLEFSTRYLNALDKQDILWAIQNKVELIAASFVNSKDDVNALKRFIAKNGGEMKIISKIESQRGIQNIDEIVAASDGVMVARGDLGVELPIEVLPELQKMIIRKCVMAGKTVITATEMLESMMENSRPTRAEVSDIANAIYDGTSCVMLSGETARGNHPIEAVRTMTKVCLVTEKFASYAEFAKVDKNTYDPISHAVVSASTLPDIKAIVSFTNSGTTAGLISRFRPKVPLIALTPNDLVYKQMEIRWGVVPVLTKVYETTDDMFKIAANVAKNRGVVKSKDKILVTCGEMQEKETTNTIKIVEI